MQKLLLTDHDVAELLGVSRTTVWNLTKRKVMPQPVKIEGNTRWRRLDIEMWVANECRPPNLREALDVAEAECRATGG